MARTLLALTLLAAIAGASARAEEPDYWLPGRDWSREADPEFQIHYEAGAAPWIVAREQGGIAYLLFEFPPRILRYDMVAESWLADLVFAATPSAMAVDGEGVYVAFGADVERFALDGTGETFLYTAPFSVREMLVDGNILFLSALDKIETVDKGTGALLDSQDYFFSMRGFSIAPSANELYSRSSGISPADIMVVPYTSGGGLGPQTDSPYHGAYPSATRTWTLPGDQDVADNSGIVYTGALGYDGSLAGPFDDLAFHASGPIALRGSVLYAHGWNFLETGQLALAQAVETIFVHGDSIFGFFSSAEGADVVVVPKSALVPQVPGPPVDPGGLAYAPDQILGDGAGGVYLLSRDNLSVFRWSRAGGDYLPTIPLVEAPQHIAYSAPNGRLYLDYPSGKVTQVDVSSPAPLGGLEETPILNSPQQPCGLSTAGPWIFLCDPSGAWVSHFTYSPAGDLVSQVEWNYFSLEYVWSEVNERIYFLRDDTSPKDVLWEIVDPATGLIGNQMDSPLHDSFGMTHPIRVHPQGFIVLLGSGRYHQAITLELLGDIGTGVVDAQWFGPRLVTLHPAAGGGSELRVWNDFLSTVIRTVPLSGDPVRLLPDQGDLIAVTSVGGVPLFTVYQQTIFTDGFESGDTSAWTATVP